MKRPVSDWARRKSRYSLPRAFIRVYWQSATAPAISLREAPPRESKPFVTIFRGTAPHRRMTICPGASGEIRRAADAATALTSMRYCRFSHRLFPACSRGMTRYARFVKPIAQLFALNRHAYFFVRQRSATKWIVALFTVRPQCIGSLIFRELIFGVTLSYRFCHSREDGNPS